MRILHADLRRMRLTTAYHDKTQNNKARSYLRELAIFILQVLKFP